MTLPVGTRVRMSSIGKAHYKNCRANPHDMLGVLEKSYRGSAFRLPYYVIWGNGCGNAYGPNEIEPVIDVSSKSLEDYL